MVGWDATGPASQTILQGTLPRIPDADDATDAILRHLKAATTDQIPTDISSTELSNAYRRWKEQTATSPSGLHLGHYKAVTRRNGMANKDTTAPAHRITDIHTRMLNLCVANQHVLDRWRTVSSVMIEKIPGRPLLPKLRVIHLIEADLNFLLGILWGGGFSNTVKINSYWVQNNGDLDGDESRSTSH